MTGKPMGDWRVPALEAAMAMLVAVALGLDFGVTNQNTYLLPVVRCLDPQLLAADWLATQTTPYHKAFAGLLCGLGQWLPLAELSIALNTALTGIGAWLVFVALRKISGPQGVLIALGGVALLAALIISWDTKSAAGSYIFDSYLQPSSIAAIFLLAAMVAWLYGAAVACGIALGICGVFHANFALLAPPAFVLAALLDRELPWRRSLPALLVPATLAFLYHLPAMIAAALGDGAAAAAAVFQAVRSPHHYDIRVFGSQLVPLAAWAATGMAFALLAPPSPARRRLCVLLGGMSAIVAGGSLLAALGVRPVISLFPWRLAPFAVLLAQVGFVGGLITMLSRPAPARSVAAALVACALAGAALVLTIPMSADGRPPAATLAALVWLPFVIVPVLALLRPWSASMQAPTATWTALCVAALLAALVLEGLPNLRNSTVFRDAVPADERALYDWTASTPSDAIYLVPPGLENFRLQARRAIVVDWKSTPILPGELLQWYRRIEDVAGRPGVMSRQAAESGYAAMDQSRMRALAARYGASYAVLDARVTSAEKLCVPVYRNDRYFVCPLQP